MGETFNRGLEISDADILSAMKDIGQYIDVTPGDFKALYVLALEHAIKRLESSVRVRDIMTRKVWSVTPGNSLEEASRLMDRHEVSGLPVVEDDGSVVGVLSEKDFLILVNNGGGVST